MIFSLQMTGFYFMDTVEQLLFSDYLSNMKVINNSTNRRAVADKEIGISPEFIRSCIIMLMGY